MFRLEEQKLNGVNIVKWQPEDTAIGVLYYKITTGCVFESEAYDLLLCKYEALPESEMKPSWGYWDRIIKYKKDVEYVGYCKEDGHDNILQARYTFFLRGPAGKSENVRESRKKAEKQINENLIYFF